MPLRTASVPKHAPAWADGTDNPYHALVAAIVHRAVEDAQGHTVYPGAKAPGQIEVEARVWLQDGRDLATLVELCGLEAGPVLRRVRQLLTTDMERSSA